MKNTIINHSVGSLLFDKKKSEESFLASLYADSFGLSIYEYADDITEDTILPSRKNIPMWLALSSAFFTKNPDDDDYQDPDNDEILHDIFSDEDDDYWNDNYDVD